MINKLFNLFKIFLHYIFGYDLNLEKKTYNIFAKISNFALFLFLYLTGNIKDTRTKKNKIKYISLSSSGHFSYFHIGVIYAIREKCPEFLNKVEFVSASGGAWVALAEVLKLDINEMINDNMSLCRKSSQLNILNDLNKYHYFSNSFSKRRKIMNLQDIQKIHIATTELNWRSIRSKIWSNYPTIDKFKQALFGTICIPFITNKSYVPSFFGSWDGGFLSHNPFFEDYMNQTLFVSAMDVNPFADIKISLDEYWLHAAYSFRENKAKLIFNDGYEQAVKYINNNAHLFDLKKE